MAAEIEEVEEMAGPSDGHAQNQENTVEDNRRLRKDYRDFAKNAERKGASPLGCQILNKKRTLAGADKKNSRTLAEHHSMMLCCADVLVGETEALVDLRTGKLVKSITNLNKLHIKGAITIGRAACPFFDMLGAAAMLNTHHSRGSSPLCSEGRARTGGGHSMLLPALPEGRGGCKARSSARGKVPSPCLTAHPLAHMTITAATLLSGMLH